MLGHAPLHAYPMPSRHQPQEERSCIQNQDLKKPKVKADLSCQILALASDNHKKRKAAAEALLAATRIPGSTAPQPFSIFGGIRIKIHVTAGDTNNSKKQMSNVLSLNMAERLKTHVARVNLVNKEFKNHPEWALEASNNIDY